MKTYDITYSCGCVHEIGEEQGVHQATGNNKDCNYHVKKEDEK